MKMRIVKYLGNNMAEIIENFRYNDIVLYCKGWYYKNGNMLEDLGYLFSKIYGWVPTDIKDIAYFMLRAWDTYLDESGTRTNYGQCHGFAEFNRVINNYMRLYDCDFNMACIKWVCSNFVEIGITTIRINRPVYNKNQYFRLGGEYANKQGMTYKHMNDIAIRTFGKDN